MCAASKAGTPRLLHSKVSTLSCWINCLFLHFLGLACVWVLQSYKYALRLASSTPPNYLSRLALAPQYMASLGNSGLQLAQRVVWHLQLPLHDPQFGLSLLLELLFCWIPLGFRVRSLVCRLPCWNISVVP